MEQPSEFQNRDALIAHVKKLSPWANGPASPLFGGRSAGEKKLAEINPIKYGRNRNFGDGNVTQLSPYIRHGIISLNEVRNAALIKCSQPQHIYKFIQELAWRDYWQTLHSAHPEWIWHDIEPYKTGYTACHYADNLPEDILTGKTGIACIDAFIEELINTGYLHNHARMYLASYVVHFRRIKWQAGARWFIHHLLDGDLASNNLSWQWVASTFSNKPYIFNLENVHKYFADLVNTNSEANKLLDASYADLTQLLFPHLRVGHE